MFDRFARQRGLVNQDTVRDLKIAIVSVPELFEEALVTIAGQLGIEDFPCLPNEAEFFIHYGEGFDINCKQTIPVTYGGDGVFLDGRRSNEIIHPLYEPAVATIAASLTLNEVLRRAGAFLPVEIPKMTVSVNIRVDERSMIGTLDDIKMSLKGRSVHTNIQSTDDGTGHRRVMLRLGEDDPLTKELRESLVISKMNLDGQSEPSRPVIEFDIKNPTRVPEGHVTIVGAGGLGTWVMKTMVAGLSSVDTGSLKILVFDGDMQVENHNLNRQVIFTEDDLGKPKAKAARDWLNSNLPNADIDIAYELKDLHLQDTRHEEIIDEGGIELEDIEGGEIACDELQVIEDEEVRTQLKETSVILGCLDAMRPRALADLAAARINQPYVNAGVKGLEANYREFKDSSLVSYYGPKNATDRTIISCQEDGEVPVASIVLTNALVASFQCIAALQRLSGYEFSSIESIYWRLRLNEITCITGEGEVSRKQFVAGLESAIWPPSKDEDRGFSTQSNASGVEG